MNDTTHDKVIAVDFDGCLCEDAYPEIGAPHWDVIVAAARERENGAALILWTCREGVLLRAALEACKRWGLTFDAVNESLPRWRAAYGNDPRKIGATEYWDDKAVQIPLAPVAENGLISREGLLEWVREFHPHEKVFASAVINAPAVDAAPVVHGLWIPVPSSDLATGKAYKCSACDKMRYGSFLPPFCQMCGAKMDRARNWMEAKK